MDPRLREDDGGEMCEDDGVWIPAYARMTEKEYGRRLINYI